MSALGKQKRGGKQGRRRQRRPCATEASWERAASRSPRRGARIFCTASRCVCATWRFKRLHACTPGVGGGGRARCRAQRPALMIHAAQISVPTGLLTPHAPHPAGGATCLTQDGDSREAPRDQDAHAARAPHQVGGVCHSRAPGLCAAISRLPAPWRCCGLSPEDADVV